MAQTSDEICARKGVTREETDAFAARSHKRTPSIENGVFEDEIVDVVIKSRRGEKVITAKDEDHVVRDTSPESFETSNSIWPRFTCYRRKCIRIVDLSCCGHQISLKAEATVTSHLHVSSAGGL